VHGLLLSEIGQQQLAISHWRLGLLEASIPLKHPLYFAKCAK